MIMKKNFSQLMAATAIVMASLASAPAAMAHGSAEPAHGGVVHALDYRALAHPIRAERRFLVPNVSLTTLLPRADGWVLRTLSDVAHLASSPGDNFPFE